MADAMEFFRELEEFADFYYDDAALNPSIGAPPSVPVISPTVKPFKCQFCPFTSNAQGGVSMHSKMHNRVVPDTEEDLRYKCSFCPYKSRIHQNLQVHERRHLVGGKPFKCTKCPKAFSEKLLLSNHMDFKHLGKVVFCPDCKKPFKSTVGYYQHRKKHRDGSFEEGKFKL